MLQIWSLLRYSSFPSEPDRGGDDRRAVDGAPAVLLDHDLHRRRNGRRRHSQSQVSQAMLLKRDTLKVQGSDPCLTRMVLLVGVGRTLHLDASLYTEAGKMACTWFGEIPSCCSLTFLLGPAWVLLTYVLQTIFSSTVSTILPSVYGKCL